MNELINKNCKERERERQGLHGNIYIKKSERASEFTIPIPDRSNPLLPVIEIGKRNRNRKKKERKKERSTVSIDGGQERKLEQDGITLKAAETQGKGGGGKVPFSDVYTHFPASLPPLEQDVKMSYFQSMI